MQLDECIPSPSTKEKTYASTILSLEWAKKSRDAFCLRKGYGQFGIVQGSTFKEFRELSAKELMKLDFDGYALEASQLEKDKMSCLIQYLLQLHFCQKISQDI